MSIEINDSAKVETLFAKFIELVNQRYKMNCKRNGETETLEGFTSYLLGRSIINKRTVARYMVMELYPKAMYETDGRKQPAIELVSDETGLGERTIWNMVAHPPDFTDKSNR